MAHENRLAQGVQLVTTGHQVEIVLMRFAEADAGIDGDAGGIDSGGGELRHTLAEELVDFAYGHRIADTIAGLEIGQSIVV